MWCCLRGLSDVYCKASEVSFQFSEKSKRERGFFGGLSFACKRINFMGYEGGLRLTWVTMLML